MANEFKKPTRIDYESLEQDPIDPVNNENIPLSTEFEGTEPIQTKAEIIVDEFDRTIEFEKFIEGLLRDLAKVEVEINPQDDPEVWIAMNRVFDNPSPKLNQTSYYQVLDALEVIEKTEIAEEDPRNNVEDDFLNNLPNVQEAEEGEIKGDFQISAIDEIENKAKVKRSSALKAPTPPAPPATESSDKPTERRRRNLGRIVDVLGQAYKVNWIRDRLKRR